MTGAQDLATPTAQGIDLSNLDVNKLAATPTALPASESRLVEKSYDPAPARENIRGRIAMLLVRTLVGVIAIVVLTGLATIYVCRGKDACSSDVAELKAVHVVIDLVLTPLVGLVGAVTDSTSAKDPPPPSSTAEPWRA